MSILKRGFERLGARQPTVLASLMIVIVSLWGLAEVADEVGEGDTHQVDMMVVKSLRDPNDLSRPIGPEWLQEVGRDVTALGGTTILVFFSLAAGGYLLLIRRVRTFWFLTISISAGIALSSIMKHLFDRPRPDVVPHLAKIYTKSFPSGHSMMSAIVYLTLGILLAGVLPRRRLKAYVFLLALMLTGMVGLSRVYLGVHYPTDVLAGWATGIAWALGCWLTAHWIGRVRREMVSNEDSTE